MNLFTSHKLKESELPEKLRENISRWRATNPEFKYKYFNDIEVEEWISENLHDSLAHAFKLLKAGAAKADFFRIAYIQKCGGIWHDADLPAFDIISKNKNLPHLLSLNDLVLIHNRKAKGLRYTLIGGASQNLLLEKFLYNLANNITNYSTDLGLKTIELTGPIAFYNFLRKENISPKIGEITRINDYSIAFIEDIVPENDTYASENTIEGYRDMLKEMNVKYHSSDDAVNNSLLSFNNLNSGSNMDKFVHLHLAKTAGTSIVKLLKSSLKNDLVIFDANKQDEFLNKTSNDCWRVLSGHFSGGNSQVRSYISNYKKFTVLRDPVERFVSFYKYICSRPNTGLHKIFSNLNLFEAAQWCIDNKKIKGVDMAKNSQCSGIIANSNVDATFQNAQLFIKQNFVFVCAIENLDELNNFFIKANIIPSNSRGIPHINTTDKKDSDEQEINELRQILSKHLKEDMDLHAFYKNNGSYFAKNLL